MTKPQLVDFACNFFEDDGNLRSEMSALTKEDLLELLFDNGADEPEVVEPVEVTPKPEKGKLDLGYW